MAERGYSFSLTTFRCLVGERAVGLGSRQAGRRARGRTAHSLRGALFRRRGGREGVGTLQSHRVLGGSAEPGLPALGGGGGWTWAEGAGVGKATGIRRLRLRGTLSWLLGVFVSGTAAGAAGERSGG